MRGRIRKEKFFQMRPTTSARNSYWLGERVVGPARARPGGELSKARSTHVERLFVDGWRSANPVRHVADSPEKPPFGAPIASTYRRTLRRALKEGYLAMIQSEDFLSSLLIAPEPTVDSQPEAPAARRPFAADRRPSTPAPREEALVVDERSGLRPAHVVESKLTRMLKEASLPASHLQMRGLLRSR
jgi:hypothetical protein